MKPSEQIRTEHRVIGKAVTSMLAIADAASRNKEIPASMLQDELEFIQGFTEDCHHRKEEEVLFPELEAQLRTASHDPVPELIQEHRRGRELMETLKSAVGDYAGGDRVAIGTIAGLAAEYSALIIEHMRKENTVIINLIENMLPANKKLEVAERFLLIEEDLGPGYHQRFEELADALRLEGRDLAA